MKVHTLLEHLQKKLPFVQHAVSSRSQLPVLLNILIEAKNGKLRIAATDLEIGIEVVLQANVEEEGGITVPAKVFLELISSLPVGKVTLETKGASLLILTEKTKSTLQTIAQEEFPALYEEKGTLLATLKRETVQKELGKVVFAASSDTARPALSGMLLQQEANGFLLVATDGYRLSLLHLASVTATEKEGSTKLLIPARIIREMLALKNDEDIEVYVSAKSNQVLFIEGDTTIVGRLIEAEFPNYERIIPTHVECTATVDREELQKAVKTCAIFARETSNIVKLTLHGQKITVSANTPSLGDNTVEVEATLSGEGNEIAFNARYLLDVLANIDEETLAFEITGPLNPGVFKVQGNQTFLHLIMPIRVQG